MTGGRRTVTMTIEKTLNIRKKDLPASKGKIRGDATLERTDWSVKVILHVKLILFNCQADIGDHENIFRGQNRLQIPEGAWGFTHLILLFSYSLIP